MSSMSRRHLMFAATGIAAAAAAPASRLRAGRRACPGCGRQPARSRCRRCPIRPMRSNRISTPRRWKSITTGITQAYVTNLNNVAKTNPQLGTAKIEDVLGNLNALDDGIKFAVRNNLGGHANHTMFWEIMGPNGGKPEGEVLAAIDRDLGGMEKFQTDFNAAGGRQFGSGWVFVTVGKDGKLAIETRPNQDNPMMDGKRALMGNDVWEHAYYLNYQNRRADYLKAWWNTVNWAKIAERYAAAKAGTLGV